MPFPVDVVLAGEITGGSSFKNAEVDSDGKVVVDTNGRDKKLDDLSLSSGCLGQSLDYIESIARSEVDVETHLRTCAVAMTLLVI